MADIIDIASNVAFPIFVAVAEGIALKYMYDKHRDERVSSNKELLDAITHNTLVMTRLFDKLFEEVEVDND